MKRKLAMVGLISIVAALACNVPGLFGPTPIPVSTQAAGQLIGTLSSITPGASGEVTISMTDTQLTSVVAIELAKTPDVPITDPQIALDNGIITMSGKMDSGLGLGLDADVKIEMQPAVGADGKPDVTISSAQFGPVDVPQGVLDGASEVVNQALAEEINAEAGGEVTLHTITVDDGVMTITGTVEQ